MSFMIEHEKWIRKHLAQRQGERKDALRRGHGYGNRLFAEKIWWPLMGHFIGLHPEYEVRDLRGRSYFVDFMWILGGHFFAFEIELHKQTVIKYCRILVDKGKFRAVPSGGSVRIRQYEYLGSTLSPDLI